MILKAQEDSRADIALLTRLSAHPQADETTRGRLAEQIRNLRSGDRGEAEAAYEIDFHFGSNPNWMIIHDLRIEHAGFVAQIDHLMINRLLEFWVLESKRFAHGVKINEHGEFTTFFDGRPRGAPSPIEQNQRHLKLLARMVADGAIKLPTTLGFTRQPVLKSLILISQGAIGRPRAKVAGLDTVIKNDQLATTVTRALDSVNPLAVFGLVGRDTLASVGAQMLALHRPITRRWAAQFGLDPGSLARIGRPPTNLARRRVGPEPHTAPATPQCGSCQAPVTKGIVAYCAQYTRFGGRILCIACQPSAACAAVGTP